MKYIYYCFILVLFNIECLGQDIHLTPVPGIFDSYDFHYEYAVNVREVLFKNLGKKFVSRIVVTPSFKPEYLLSFENKKDSIILLYNEASEVIWDVKDLSKVRALTFRCKVDAEFSDKVRKAIDHYLTEVRYPMEKYAGADGVTYQFFTFNQGYGIHAGQTWSPTKGARLSKLISLVDKLKGICMENNYTSKRNEVLNFCKVLEQE
jgi:hypothetical protein